MLLHQSSRYLTRWQLSALKAKTGPEWKAQQAKMVVTVVMQQHLLTMADTEDVESKAAEADECVLNVEGGRSGTQTNHVRQTNGCGVLSKHNTSCW